jgi:hypothetical protein
MHSPPVFTLSEIAREHGIYPVTVSDLSKLWAIKLRPVPRNGSAKGVSEDDLKILLKAMNRHEPDNAAK